MAGRIALRWGGATNVGRVRAINEDNYLARDDVGIWAVADGMGGHRGGEIASAIACDALGEAFTERSVEGLVRAVEHANAAVFQAGADDPELSGMGTTLVALAVVDEPDGEQLAIANVGDSRIYRYSLTDLDQLTDDHSLVADMVRDGSLSPEEAAVHPQRNIVTRVLGPNEHVPVDAETFEPRHGDRYVLCSDGLFNEVPESTIATVLRRVENPRDAADELVHLAIESGGRDNITVVIVDVVDDGGQSLAASEAVARMGGPTGTAPHPVVHPEDDGADDEVDNQSGSRGRRRRARRGDSEDDGSPGDTPEARPRRVTWRVVLFVVVLVALVGGAIGTIEWYGRSAYFVGFNDDRVTIFRGRPGGVLWRDPELVESTDLERERVPAEEMGDIQAGKEMPTLGRAQAYVARVTERADELAPTTPTTLAAGPGGEEHDATAPEPSKPETTQKTTSTQAP